MMVMTVIIMSMKMILVIPLIIMMIVVTIAVVVMMMFSNDCEDVEIDDRDFGDFYVSNCDWKEMCFDFSLLHDSFWWSIDLKLNVSDH